ncbi:uncharacterized protein LOC116601886 [Nematostella vectensis]|uniref:uncharacterized protein LOC116601886 n=1 Tax=Nematostella vectensis TaxID=45351 RepID=UPI00138FBD5F|nr:uncharacterized protein LOC116601886 [Nematostella vectensis]
MTDQPTAQDTNTEREPPAWETTLRRCYRLSATSRTTRDVHALCEAYCDHVDAVGEFMSGKLNRIAGQVEEIERERDRLRALCDDYEVENSSLNSKVYGLERELLDEQSINAATILENANLSHEVGVLEDREETLRMEYDHLRMEYDHLRMQIDYADYKDTCDKGTQVPSPNEDPQDMDHPTDYELGYSAAVRTYQPMLLDLDAKVHKFMDKKMKEKTRQKTQLLKKLKRGEYRTRNHQRRNVRKLQGVGQHYDSE